MSYASYEVVMLDHDYRSVTLFAVDAGSSLAPSRPPRRRQPQHADQRFRGPWSAAGPKSSGRRLRLSNGRQGRGALGRLVAGVCGGVFPISILFAPTLRGNINPDGAGDTIAQATPSTPRQISRFAVTWGGTDTRAGLRATSWVASALSRRLDAHSHIQTSLSVSRPSGSKRANSSYRILQWAAPAGGAAAGWLAARTSATPTLSLTGFVTIRFPKKRGLTVVVGYPWRPCAEAVGRLPRQVSPVPDRRRRHLK